VFHVSETENPPYTEESPREGRGMFRVKKTKTKDD